MIIKKGRIVDPNGRDEIADLYIKDGKIEVIGKDMYIEEEEVIDASGCLVVPGFVDAHVHLREPGFEHKETIRTGTMAAAVGGFTTVACMPNTNPVMDSKETIKYVLEQGQRTGLVNVLPIGSITKNLMGLELAPIEELVRAGAIAISDDGKTTMDMKVMERAFEKAKELDIPLIDHCEDYYLANGGCINEGKATQRTGLKGISNASEWSVVARDLILAKTYGTHVHIAHVSTKESVNLIRKAKLEGIKVTAEVCPHHFALDDDMVNRNETGTKVNPPLRGVDDVKAILEGIADGTIDIIATDHAPHDTASKEVEYEQASFGISGLETAFQIAYTELVCKNIISLNRLIEMLTLNPARVLRTHKGTLTIGKEADITILNLDQREKIDKNRFLSKGKNTPFHGREVQGKVVATIVGGKKIMVGGKIVCL